MAEYLSHEDNDTTGKPMDTDNPEAEAASKKSVADVSINGDSHGKRSNGSLYDPDAQHLVITSLRAQIQDLVGQVTQLNNKLVKSYDRVSDLEDELHVTSSQLRTSSVKVSQLELEHSQHISALSTGLLVEKSHVTNELNRLMDKATEEAAQRGQAESARAAIEKELEDLSANLFNQANTMVAEARYAQHLSQRKTAEAESALKSAEEAVGVMQLQMQSLREEKEVAEEKAQEMQVSMGKGKWVEMQRDGTNITRSLRLLGSHVPYQEFMLFVAHLRSIHNSTPQPPSMSTLLALPFLQRLSSEDSEPTVRLDQAPSLNWLSRRSVLAAIYGGQLVVEPMSASTLFCESGVGIIAGINSGGNDMPCGLCGSPIFTKDEISRTFPLLMLNGGTNSWSTSLFKKSQSTPHSGTNPPTPQRSPSIDFPQVFIFRVAVSPSTANPSFPVGSPQQQQHYITSQSTTSQSSTIYPLCKGSWCLTRLRATCQLWSFVRTGIVEKIWEEELPAILPPPPRISVPVETSKPPVPPRRKGFWGMASALGEKAATWSEAAKKIAPSVQADQQHPPPPQHQPQTGRMERQGLATKLPPPPPTHPSIAAAHGSAPPTASQPTAATSGSSTAPMVAPPLPRRNEGRSHDKTPSPQSPDASPPVPAESSDSVAPQPSENREKSVAPPQEASKETLASSPPRVTTPLPTTTDQQPEQNSPPPIPRRAAGHKRHSSLLPERVPLPESRPGTPVLNAGPPSRPSSPAPSPAPGTAGAGTGGSVPPSIPRRAAARGGSRLTVSTAGEPTPRPNTPPVQAPAAAGPVTETAKRSEGTKQDGDEVVNSEGNGDSSSKTPQEIHASAAEKVPESHAEAQLPLGETKENPTASSKEEEKAVEATPDGSRSSAEEGAATSVDSTTTGAETAAPETESAQKGPTVEEATSHSGNDTTSLQVARIDEEDPTSNGADSDASNMSLLGSSKVAPPSPFNSIGSNRVDGHVASDGEQAADGDSKEVFVGGATWEERTWKELVRLREDMFWARIGGLR